VKIDSGTVFPSAAATGPESERPERSGSKKKRGVNVTITTFGDFRQFSVKQNDVSLVNQCYDPFLLNLAVF
jgi:hypothetical protein